MPSTTHCPSCRMELTVPDEARGRRLRCPRCASRFYPDGAPAPPPSPGSRPASTLMAAAPRDDDAPIAPGSLRDTFDLPLLEPAPAADPTALFRGDEPVARPSAPRSRPRRCPECGWTVPAGMSICKRCDLDLDSGRHVALPGTEEVLEDDDDLLDDASTAAGRRGPPVGVLVVGISSLAASLGLGVLTMMTLGTDLGGLSLGLLCVFGALASLIFLIGHASGPLLVALTLAAGVDLVGLVVLPVIQANATLPSPADPASPADLDAPAIPRLDQRLDAGRLSLGIALLAIDLGAIVYLTTAGVRSHFAGE